MTGVFWKQSKVRPHFGVLLLVLAICSLACQKEAKVEDKPAIAEENATPPLSREFLRRAEEGLNKILNGETLLFELRATGNRLSVQMLPPPSFEGKARLVQFDYVESQRKDGAEPLTEVLGPFPIPIEGEGKLEENLFAFKEIQLYRMARSFKVALLAVDPEAGAIERLVVRRYLPFSERIRGRIFVKSPRMNGSIDVNEKGMPLKR